MRGSVQILPMSLTMTPRRPAHIVLRCLFKKAIVLHGDEYQSFLDGCIKASAGRSDDNLGQSKRHPTDMLQQQIASVGFGAVYTVVVQKDILWV